MFPRPKARKSVRTRVKSERKFIRTPGQLSAVINTFHLLRRSKAD